MLNVQNYNLGHRVNFVKFFICIVILLSFFLIFILWSTQCLIVDIFIWFKIISNYKTYINHINSSSIHTYTHYLYKYIHQMNLYFRSICHRVMRICMFYICLSVGRSVCTYWMLKECQPFTELLNKNQTNKQLQLYWHMRVCTLFSIKYINTHSLYL